MQSTLPPAAEHPAVAHRRPSGLDFYAGALLAVTVVLHVVAMFPAYFAGAASTAALVAEPDQAALYSVVAASWALALVIGLTGPDRTPVAAAVAVGLAVTEMGFRLADLGDVVRFGTSTAGSGLWIMSGAWLVGVLAAVVAVVAARRRHRPGGPAPQPAPPSFWTDPTQGPPAVDWSAPANPYGAGAGDAPSPFAPGPGGPPSPADPAQEVTTTLPAPEPTSVWAAVGAGPDTETPEAAHERNAWSMLIAVLAIVVAGAFLPAWDHAVAVSTTSGQTISHSLGNAFSGPWEQVVGTVLAGVALLVVPAAASRLRNRAIGAGVVIGGLLMLAAQLAAAVVQVNQPVSPNQFGISASQASQLGLQTSLRLTGWFTVDALAAYALFAAVMVWATLREVPQENSPGIRPSAPEFRNDWTPWAS